MGALEIYSLKSRHMDITSKYLKCFMSIYLALNVSHKALGPNTKEAKQEAGLALILIPDVT